MDAPCAGNAMWLAPGTAQNLEIVMMVLQGG
jgi:hypothetical protein